MTDQHKIKKLNSVIEGLQKEIRELNEDHWYSYKNQKKLVFNLASQLKTQLDLPDEQCIAEAQNFVDTFYTLKIGYNRK